MEKKVKVAFYETLTVKRMVIVLLRMVNQKNNVFTTRWGMGDFLREPVDLINLLLT